MRENFSLWYMHFQHVVVWIHRICGWTPQPQAIDPTLCITSVLLLSHWLDSKPHACHSSLAFGYLGYALPFPSRDTPWGFSFLKIHVQCIWSLFWTPLPLVQANPGSTNVIVLVVPVERMITEACLVLSLISEGQLSQAFKSGAAGWRDIPNATQEYFAICIIYRFIDWTPFSPSSVLMTVTHVAVSVQASLPTYLVASKPKHLNISKVATWVPLETPTKTSEGENWHIWF